MGEAWARCKICGKKFYASYDPRFDRGNPAGEMARLHVWEEHRDQLPSWLKTFEQFILWDAGKLEAPAPQEAKQEEHTN